MKKNTLQGADTKTIGFIPYTLRNHNAQTWMEYLNEFSATKVNNDGWPPVIFSAEMHVIYDCADEKICKK